jgi:hypothetical protein
MNYQEQKDKHSHDAALRYLQGQTTPVFNQIDNCRHK